MSVPPALPTKSRRTGVRTGRPPDALAELPWDNNHHMVVFSTRRLVVSSAKPEIISARISLTPVRARGVRLARSHFNFSFFQVKPEREISAIPLISSRRRAVGIRRVLVIDPGWRVSTNSKKAERWQGSKSSSCGHTPASPRSRANSSRRRRRASGPASRRAASRTSCGRRAAAGAAGVAAKAECRPIGVPVKPPPADGRASTDGQRRPH
jgi:hypothetical protein